MAVVKAVGGGVDEPSRAHPYIPGCVHYGSGASHPHGALTLSRFAVDREDVGRTSGLRDTDHSAPVARAIAVVAAHTKDNTALVKGQSVRSNNAAGSAPDGSTACDSSTWPEVLDRPREDMRWLAMGEFVGHDEHFGACWVDDWCSGDPDGR